MEKKQNTLYVGSLAKGLRLLRAFDESHTELSLVELAGRSGLDKSAVQRLANTLHIEGMHGSNWPMLITGQINWSGRRFPS